MHWIFQLGLLAYFAAKGCCVEVKLENLTSTDVFVNDDLLLKCYCPASDDGYVWWEIGYLSATTMLKNKTCLATGYLTNETAFGIECLGNCVFTVLMKGVTLEMDNINVRCRYMFTVSNTITIRIKVRVQTAIISLPNGNVVRENHTLLVECETSYSRPIANIQWFLNNGTSNLSTDIRITANTEESYVNKSVNNTYNRSNILMSARSRLLYQVHRWMNGQKIYCKANNTIDNSVRSEMKNLNVTYPPSIGHLENRSISEGSVLEVTCPSLPGNPPYTRYKWTHLDNKKEWIEQQLRITNVSRTDDGEYTCTVFNNMVSTTGSIAEGNTSRSFHLNVSYKASVNYFSVVGFEGQKTVTVNENETVQFYCDIDSNPRATIRLYFNGQNEIFRSSNTKQLTYEQENVTCLNGGFYSCVANNYYNYRHPSTSILLLQVLCPPRASSDTGVTTVYARPNSTALFTFNALAFPEPGPLGFIWHKVTASKWTPLTASSKYQISSTELQTKLLINSVTSDDYGSYMLSVDNGLGRYEQKFYLIDAVKDIDSVGRYEESCSCVTTIVTACLVSVFVTGVAFVIIIHSWRRYKMNDRDKDRDLSGPSSDFTEMQENPAEEMTNRSGPSYQDLNILKDSEQAYEKLKTERAEKPSEAILTAQGAIKTDKDANSTTNPVYDNLSLS